MALRDYSNGEGPLSGLINQINDNEEQRHRQHIEHLETAGEIGLSFVIGSLVHKFLNSRQ